MAIPESLLSTWANLGAVKTAMNAHESVRSALAAYEWPDGVNYSVYLQGSYANTTNVRGSSDVDVVVELHSTFSSNLTDAEKATLKIRNAGYRFEHFCADVGRALQSYYSDGTVDVSGGKCHHVASTSNRQPADVLPCIEYRLYRDLQVLARGIRFWTRPGYESITNYPELHIQNGVAKNREDRTNGWFKHAVRVFKNARDSLPEPHPAFPSYFIECLVYNVPDAEFGSSYVETFVRCLRYWNRIAAEGRLDELRAQGHMDALFGEGPIHWNRGEALDFLVILNELWKEW